MSNQVTRVKIAILEAGLTQRDVSRITGVHETTVSRIASGRYVPNAIEQIKIARALEKTADQLFENVRAESAA